MHCMSKCLSALSRSHCVSCVDYDVSKTWWFMSILWNIVHMANVGRRHSFVVLSCLKQMQSSHRQSSAIRRHFNRHTEIDFLLSLRNPSSAQADSLCLKEAPWCADPRLGNLRRLCIYRLCHYETSQCFLQGQTSSGIFNNGCSILRTYYNLCQT